MKSVILNLGMLAAGCGLILGIANWQTRPLIEASQAEYARAQLLEIVGDRFVLLPDGEQAFLLLDGEQPAGHLFQVVAPDGYNGDIRFWLGVSLDGAVLGARVIEHRETPGLGDRFLPEVSDWIFSLEGKSLANARWDVKPRGDFDAFTGATITPRAIVRATYQALSDYPNSAEDQEDE